MDTETKLHGLATMARRLNAARIVWAVGGSMLLYFKGIVPEFHDIDIFIKTEDSETVKILLTELGTLKTSKPSDKYQSKAFYELSLDGVEVDVIAGFTIINDGVAHDCSLRDDEINETIEIEGETVPLHSLTAWRRNYSLMNKPDKVRWIDEALQRASTKNSR